MQYRKRIPITGSAGAGTNYQVKVTVNSGNGTDGTAVVYLNGKGNAFPNDLRVADSDGSTVIPFWIDPIESTSTSKVLWIRPTDDLSSGTQYIYVYYGDSETAMTNSLNAENTFNFYENFDSYNTGDINGQGSWTASAEADIETTVIKNGTKALQIVSGAVDDKNAIKSLAANGNTNKSFTFYMRDTRPDAVGKFTAGIYVYEGNSIVTGVTFYNNLWQHLKSGAWETFGGTPAADTWYKVTIDFPTASTHRIFINDSLQSLTSSSNFTNIVTSTNKIKLQRFNANVSGVAYFDYVFVREKIATEPAVGTSDAEELTDDTPVVHTFAASDDPITGLTVAVFMTGSALEYLITESSATPSASDPSWSSSIPTSYTTASAGAKTLYAWGKNGSDEISSSLSDTHTFYVGSTEYQTVVAIMPGTRYAENPIFSHVPGTWESRQVHYPHVIVNPWDSAELLMYYGAGNYKTNDFAIGIATASVSDPFTWTKYGSNPVIVVGTPPACTVGPDHVFYNAATDEIWLYSSVSPAYPAAQYQGLWKSSDGYAFTFYGSVIAASGDETTLGNAGFITEGDTWYCYYTYRTASSTLAGIRLATSTGANKGTVWVKPGGADLVTRGAAYDSRYIEGLQAFKAGETFVLFYNCSNGTASPQTGVWTCAMAAGDAYDGPFYKAAENPVFNIGAIGEWDDKNVSTAFIGFLGTSYYFFYQGYKTKTSQAFTADHTTNSFTSIGNNLLLNDMIRITSTVSYPTGVSNVLDYYVVNPGDTFQISLTENGTPLDFSSNGSGVLTYVDTPDGYSAGLWDMGITTLSNPWVTAFELPATSTTLEIPVTTFTANDNTAVAGYMITESSTPPASGDAGWLGSAPSTVTASDYGIFTFYPWVKDEDGNVSTVYASPESVTVEVAHFAITGTGGVVLGGTGTVFFVKSFGIIGVGGVILGGAGIIDLLRSFVIGGDGGTILGGMAAFSGTLGRTVTSPNSILILPQGKPGMKVDNTTYIMA